jgi:hypothetical protein
VHVLVHHTIVGKGLFAFERLKRAMMMQETTGKSSGKRALRV